MIDQPAPPWRVTTLSGDAAPDLESLLGRPLLLLFFNVGCPGCMGRALPFSLDLAARYPGLQFIGIHTSFEKGSDFAPARIQAVVEYFDLPYPVYLDDGDATFLRYEAGGTPHWILIDADGIIRKSIFGSMDGARQRLDYALEEVFQSTANGTF